jgi:hypothetical protein
MMKDKYVFPRVEGQAPGMELRDLLAGFALAGLTSGFLSDDHEHWECNETYAEVAYNLADAMIAAREEE